MRTQIAFYTLVAVGLAGVLGQIVIDPVVGLPWSIAGVSLFAGGAVLGWKVSSNPVSWLLLVGGSTLNGMAFLTVLAPGVADQVLAAWLETVGMALGTAGILVLPVVLVRFPHGNRATAPWYYIEWLAGSAALLGFLAALFNGGWGGDQTQALAVSPLFERTRPLGDILSSIFYPAFLLSFSGAAASLILRYRRSAGEQRLQFKWLAFAAGFLFIAGVAVVVDSGFAAIQTDTLWEEVSMSLAFASIPAAIGVAVLKYRLYDIDIVISRTLVLAVLAGFITIIYAAVVVGLGQLIGGDSDQFLLPILATAVVAVAFEPLRLRAQRWANRLVFGNRATPYDVLSDLTERLSGAEESGGILSRMAELMRDGTGAERATVWLGDRGSMVAAATAPNEDVPSLSVDLDDEGSHAVTHAGEVVGALEVVKPRGTLLSSSERSLIADLAGSAGAVLGYQRLNDSLSRRAIELEESRNRLLGVQDAERRRLEQDLHEGAEQFIVALKVKLGVASQLSARAGNEKLQTLLSDLTDEAQAALDDVQSLAKGIYPPVLESEGLAAALSALAGSTPVEVKFESDGIDRYSAETEAAVYFGVSEAVTNAVKHAEPPIRIEMSEVDGVLRFTVVDSGPGFDLDVDDPGSGLENMADRMEAIGGELTVSSVVGTVTTVSGSIPVSSGEPR